MHEVMIKRLEGQSVVHLHCLRVLQTELLENENFSGTAYSLCASDFHPTIYSVCQSHLSAYHKEFAWYHSMLDSSQGGVSRVVRGNETALKPIPSISRDLDYTFRISFHLNGTARCLPCGATSCRLSAETPRKC